MPSVDCRGGGEGALRHLQGASRDERKRRGGEGGEECQEVRARE